MSFLDNLKEETTVGSTENGAKTYTSTLNANLDFFAQAGAMRGRLGDVRNMFAKAYDENPELALRNLVHLRNIRLGGLGERSAYLEAIKYLVDGRNQNKQVIVTLMEYMAYVGRWTDLFETMEYAHKRSIHFVDTEGARIIGNQLTSDIKNMSEGKPVSLLGKWLANVSSPNSKKRNQGARIANYLGFEGKAGLTRYRKMIAKLRDYLNVIEVRLASKEYHKIDLNQVSSKALFKYRKALQLHMPDEYEDLLSKVESGEVKMNAKNMLPHEVIRAYGSRSYYRTLDRSLEATWKSMDDVLKDIEDNAIVVADTSGSMTWGGTENVTPWEVAEGLAIYTAERLSGAFKGHFIVFSEQPRLVNLPLSGTLMDKMKAYDKCSYNARNTNLQKVFDLILSTAVKNHTPQNELPSKIVIISDMEFDQGVAGYTNYEQAKLKFEQAGYKLPSVVFWNVNSRHDNTPVRFDEKGTALVSGFSTNILTQVLGGEITSPEEMMLSVLNKPEYDFVKEALK
ncbi:DUF2828 family protein [Enterococcus faecium]|nr:DUF2828 family protein [Enterococcus faecium]